MTKRLKKSIAFLLSLTMIMTMFINGTFVLTANAATIDSVAPTTGDGTANNPYQIGTAAELYWFAEQVNGGETAICAVLTADIVVNEGGVLDENGDPKSSDFAAWTPIDNTSNGYTGTFDGAGHTISGVYLTNGGQGCGLFGAVGSGGKVCNLGVTDSYFKGTSYWNGAVCGQNIGTIENCYANATVVGYNDGGGVCGQNNGTITNCYAVAKVSGNRNVGGVCGYNEGGTITNCYYDSDVYSGDAIGTNEGTAVKVSGKSTAQFKSGEVAYLLNGSTSKGELAWGQTIGTDDYPVFNDGTNTVYATTGCFSYNNDGIEGEQEHNLVDGKCTACGLYVISTAEQLFSFAEDVRLKNTEIDAVLANDITVNEAVFDENGELKESLTEWTPIGRESSAYSGTFDGAGHTVSGLYFNKSTTENIGLFGYVGENGVVRNVGVVDSYFSGSTYVGGVCGYNNGTIANCYSIATVGGGNYIGGVCGYNKGTIANCYSIAKVSGSNVNIGGVCAFMLSGAIINCYFDNTEFTGEAVGYKAYDSTVTNVYGKTPAQFESGEVAYKLSQGCKVGETTYDGSIWGQDLSKDKSPVLGGKKVSVTTGCVSYNNDGEEGEKAHSFENGVCTVCGSYEISTAEQLFSFAAAVNGGNNEINAVLAADITVNENVLDADGNLNSGDFVAWTPIGNDDYPYNSTFDGAGHTISGLYFNDKSQVDVGLFDNVGENGVVTNVGVIDCYFNTGYGAGGVCASNYGTITNCFARGTVFGGVGVGGVCGCNYGEIANCYAVATVNAGYYHGDLCGYNDGTITNCCFFGGYAVGSGNGDENNVFSKSIAQFKSGEVTYLLNQNDGTDDDVWGQTIGTDDYPVFNDGTNTVYVTTGCVIYTNNAELNGTEKEHGEFVNDMCPDCGEYEAAEEIDGVYQIGTVTDLYWFAQAVNRGNNTINAVLTADITVNENVLKADGNLNSGEFVAWTPIGYYNSDSDNSTYNGRFDGKGHTVSGLYFNDASADYVGLFGSVGEKGGVINVGVVDSYLGGSYTVGGVCGGNEGRIAFCYFTGTVSGNYAVGGVCGGNGGLILSCYSTGVLSGEDYVGGVCGGNYGQIGLCYFDSTVYGGSAIGSDNGDVQSVLGKTTAQFASGEVAYMLNFDQSAPHWGQIIGTDKYPVFHNDNNTVYATTGCMTYSNDAELSGKEKEHPEFVNGMCPDCGEYEAAVQNAETGVYEISNAGQLYWFADKVNSGNNTIDAVLTADITVNENVLKSDGTLNGSGFIAWTPIGNDDNRYNGTFDGQNHTISGLYFNDSSAKYVGFIGYIGTDGAVCNVGVVDSYLGGYDYVGGVCGRNKGTIANCYYIGVADSSDDFGGVCGRSSGTVNNCYYDSTVCGSAIGYDSGDSENVLGKTTAQFASGEVAYLLNQNDENENDVWGQTIGTDKYPAAHNDNNTVYVTTGCVTYTNNAELIGKEKEHPEFVNGMCPDCGEFTAAVQNAETNVYEISNAGQLYWFADQVNGGNNTINAVLKNDITVNENVLKSDGTLNGSGFIAWTPIGNVDNQYNGKFDGAGHTVSGLYFNDKSAGNVGLFGVVGENGVVSNVVVVDSYINANEYIGGICGANIGKVINCYNSGVLSGSNCIGGVCGYNEGTVTNCYNTGVLSGSDCGGVCGYNGGEVKNCYYNSTIYDGDAVGYDEGTVDNVLGKTTAQFASGEVAYLLNQNDEIADDVWGQTIGKDKAPVLGGEKVYKITYKNGDAEYEADYANAGEFELPVSSLKGFVAYSDNTDYLFAGQKVQIESDISFNIVTLTIKMMNGASMRMNEQTGIRFYSQIDTDLITALRNAAENAGATVSLGTMISKKSIIGEQDFTKDMSGQIVDVRYESETWYSEDEFTGMVGSIVKIREENYNEEFVGRGYVTVTSGDVSTTVYADYDGDSISNNSRSICYIANQIMLDQTEYEALSAEKQQIVKDFADKYTGEDKYNQ